MRTHADEYRANCVQCVGGHNLKTHLDIRHLFKDFQDVYTIYQLQEEKLIKVILFYVFRGVVCDLLGISFSREQTLVLWQILLLTV